jgi:hypothetical protein
MVENDFCQREEKESGNNYKESHGMHARRNACASWIHPSLIQIRLMKWLNMDWTFKGI